MQDIAEPARYTPTPDDLLTDDLFANARAHGPETGYSRRVGDRWVPVTHTQLADRVTDVAAGLMAWGLAPGDRVAIMAGTSFEWMVCDYAIWTAGGVTVPIYETSSAEQVAWILEDSGAVGAFVGNADAAATIASVSTESTALRAVWSFDGTELDELAASGRDVDRSEVEARRTSRTSDALATIIYTSGTTGRPKGCAITHANLLCQIHNVAAATNVTELVFNDHSTTLLFIPVAHILARSIQLTAVHSRVHLAHGSDAKKAAALLVDFKPSVILAVPYIFEKIYNTAKHKAAAENKGWIFAQADATAREYSESIDRGGPSLLLRLRHELFDRLVYGKLRAALGGQVEYIVSGGAPLGARLGHFFRGIGINPLEGYGLTETCAGVTLNLPGQQRIGTVGRPLPGCSVRIADDGEVLLKGAVVFQGYWHNEEATREAFDEDGWFRTGDLGSLDADGYLTVTGRKKDIIVTAGGKNVAPAVLEDRLRAHWLVSQCLVVGDRRPYVAAMLTIDADVLPQWLAEHGHTEAAPVERIHESPELLAELQTAVDDANKAVSNAEAIKRFAVLPADFTVDDGLLTPTLKVKRAVVTQRYAAEIDSLYSQPRTESPV
ncbi:long-chain acyl-CoA synthetase [Humibacillus xanthopallidus]|uniref:Acyl-CoA synthetase n=1 Tax=Humibacillus xanthopallidus TaxID=412689 RepID=A0A543PN94_9MICO|nr:long-chain fatty acid--CoA ligase [Humibacillus xanthopallidus]TQN45544.1 long-chain acyl-CoA synthetase [Humibacillus xanthopallidus]